MDDFLAKKEKTSPPAPSIRSEPAMPPLEGDEPSADDAYFAALEAPTLPEHRKLLRFERKYHPRHTDARLALLRIRPLTKAEHLAELWKIVASAEDLGLTRIRDYVGHFWGFHETRGPTCASGWHRPRNRAARWSC